MSYNQWWKGHWRDPSSLNTYHKNNNYHLRYSINEYFMKIDQFLSYLSLSSNLPPNSKISSKMRAVALHSLRNTIIISVQGDIPPTHTKTPHLTLPHINQPIQFIPSNHHFKTKIIFKFKNLLELMGKTSIKPPVWIRRREIFQCLKEWRTRWTNFYFMKL